MECARTINRLYLRATRERRPATTQDRVRLKRTFATQSRRKIALEVGVSPAASPQLIGGIMPTLWFAGIAAAPRGLARQL